MTPAEVLMALYNAIPPPDRDGDGKPDLWERSMSIDQAEDYIAMCQGGEIDVINGRVIRISVPALCEGTETFKRYDNAHGRNAAKNAMKKYA